MKLVKTPRVAKPKPIPEHKDKLGRLLAEGNFVAYPDSNMLKFGRVVKLNPKMVKVQEVPAGRWSSENLKYPSDLVMLEDKDMTWYLLKNPPRA